MVSELVGAPAIHPGDFHRGRHPEDPAFLERLILEVAGKAAPLVKQAEVRLPDEIVSLEQLKRKPEEAKPGTPMHFVLSLGNGMLPRDSPEYDGYLSQIDALVETLGRPATAPAAAAPTAAAENRGIPA
jgi:hypothetical protein